MQINAQRVENVEDNLPQTSYMKEWFNSLKSKYPLSTYVPTYLQEHIRGLYQNIDFKMLPISEQKAEIKRLFAQHGLRFLASGTNRFTFTCDYDPNVVIKMAYNPGGKINGEAELFWQDKIAPYVTKTFEVSEDGLFSVHERIFPLEKREQLLEVSYQHLILLVSLFEKGYILGDVGTHTFRNLGIRPGFGLVILDYPTIYPVRKGDLRCRCGGRIFYDAGFNKLECKVCRRAFQPSQLSSSHIRTYRDLAKSLTNNINNNEYSGGIDMKFRLNISRNGEIIESHEYDTRRYKETPKVVVKDNQIVGAREAQLGDNAPTVKLVFSEGAKAPLNKSPLTGTKKDPVNKKKKPKLTTVDYSNGDKLGFVVVPSTNYNKDNKVEESVEVEDAIDNVEMDEDVASVIKNLEDDADDLGVADVDTEDKQSSSLDYSGLTALYGEDIANEILNTVKEEESKPEEPVVEEPRKKPVRRRTKSVEKTEDFVVPPEDEESYPKKKTSRKKKVESSDEGESKPKPKRQRKSKAKTEEVSE